MEVGARVTPTGRAGTFRVELLLGEFVNPAPHLQVTAGSEGGPALRHLRGDDAIKHIHSAMDRFEDIERRPDSHEITRLLARQELCGEFAKILALIFRFSHRETTDGKTIEWHFREASGAFFSQILEERPLHDREDRLP